MRLLQQNWFEDSDLQSLQLHLCDELTVDANYIGGLYGTNNAPRVIRAAKEVFCNIGMSARKALFAVGVPKSEAAENKGCMV